VKLANICQTFTGLQKLTLVVNGTPTDPPNNRSVVVDSIMRHGMIYFPTPVLEVVYTHYAERRPVFLFYTDPVEHSFLWNLTIAGGQGTVVDTLKYLKQAEGEWLEVENFRGLGWRAQRITRKFVKLV
jgi:hypothetical protein